jgi:hypothetical protein
MILIFDVDCGELVPGHHFIARGLGGPFRLPIPDDWDGGSAEYEQRTPSSEVDELIWLTYADRDRVSPVDQLIFDHLHQNSQLT